jgi:hypothetical protein
MRHNAMTNQLKSLATNHWGLGYDPPIRYMSMTIVAPDLLQQDHQLVQLHNIEYVLQRPSITRDYSFSWDQLPLFT